MGIILPPDIHRAINDVPELIFAVRAAITVFISVIPIFAGLRYFMYRRKIIPTWGFIVSFVGTFAMASGLAFIYASPLAGYMPFWAIRPYLFVGGLFMGFAVTELTDQFFVGYYLQS